MTAQRPWHASYEAGVPKEVDLTRYESMIELLDHGFQEYPNRPCFSCMGKEYTYAEIDHMSQRMAAFLTGRLGMNKGDRIAIMLPNIHQYPIAFYGAIRAGLIVVNVNPLYTARELEHQLKDSGAITIVILDNFAHVLEKISKKVNLQHTIVTRMGDMLGFPKGAIVNGVVKYVKKLVPAWDLPDHWTFLGALHEGEAHSFQSPKVTRDTTAFLQYTGGTTGVSKGAELTHGNLLANVEQALAWIRPHVRVGQEVILTPLPLYHIFSMTANCLTFFRIGGLNVLIPNPRDIKGFVKLWKKTKVTAMTGVNTLFNGLLNDPQFASCDFSTLQLTLGGGMAVQKPVAERWQQVTGCALSQAYGLTETSPAVTINPLSLKEFNGSIGLPVSSTEVSIRGEDFEELPLGEAGELCVKGPQVMKGYWNRPDETENCMQDGWLKTGDIATMNAEGFVTIVDRKKDMILVSGFNVFPNEVEEVIVEMDSVLEVAVVGVTHEKSGEAVKAFVVKKEPNLTVEQVVEHCRSRLTGYKVPRFVEFRDDLPKTNVGKVLRRALKDS
ncbi:MAG: AMP-binding protein [Oligoflexales bacterium]